MKKFLKLFFKSLYSNIEALGAAGARFWQGLIIVLVAIWLAILPGFVSAVNRRGSDILRGTNNSSLDVSLSILSRDLQNDDSISIVVNDEGKVVVTGFTEKEIVIRDKVTLVVRFVNENEDLNEIANYYRAGMHVVEGVTKASETPTNFLLLNEGGFYINVFGPNAKNTLNEDGSIKKYASATNSYQGVAAELRGTDLASFYVAGAENANVAYERWVDALDAMYIPIKNMNVMWTALIYSGIDLLVVLLMALIVMIISRLKSSEGQKLNYLEAMKVMFFASFSPALIAMILAFLIPAFTSFGFVLVFGIRSIFMGMKVARPNGIARQ